MTNSNRRLSWLAHVAVLLVMVASAAGAAAAVVSVDETSDVARSWFRAIGVEADASVTRALEYSEDGLPALRVVNMRPSGWIIVSAEDVVRPVLAYSLHGSFSEENLPPQLRCWLQARRLEVAEARSSGLPREPQVAEEWQRFRSNSVEVSSRASLDVIRRPLAVSNLLTTTWDQGQYYNASCPANAAGPDGHVWVGCVATAMAQIMKKWNYPITGTSSCSYVDPTYGAQFANFGATTYDWALMPDSVTSPNAAVATLMYHCGVSLYMSYGISGSGACDCYVPGALATYFRYSRSARFVPRSFAPNSSEWNAVMKTELDAGRPVQYSGGSSSCPGHSFVLAGYTTVSGSDYYDVNWGWSGLDDGTYSLDSLNPGSFCTFNDGQAAVTQIIPATQMPDPRRFEANPALPPSLTSGNSFLLNVSAGNTNSVAPTSGTITFSFPDLTGASDGANVQFSSSVPSSATFTKYPAGATIHTADGFSMTAQYLMVEMVTSDWSGVNNLTVSVTPKAAGTFRVDVRETLGNSDAWISDPAGSSDIDQQGRFVKRYEVSVVPACAATGSGGGSICAGQITTIQAALAGVAPWSVTWSDGVTQSGLVASPATRSVSPASTTTYSVTAVSDANGPGTSSGSATVTVNPTPRTPVIAQTAGTNPSCVGASITLDAGAGYTSYLWSTGATTRTLTASPAATATYTVMGTSGGCTSAAGSWTQTVNAAPAAPVITQTAGTNPSCAGASITLDAGAGYASYLWSTGATARTITVSPSATTTFTVTGTNAGCSSSSAPGSWMQTVNAVPATPVVSQTAGTNPSCAGGSITLDAGSGYTSYLWSTGATTRTIAVSPAVTTTYTVTGTTAGCTSVAGSWTQTVNPVPATPVIMAPAGTVAGTTGLTASAVSHVGGSWFWTIQNGSITAGQGTSQITFTAGAAGTPLTLSVTETNASGCISAPGTATITVTPVRSTNLFNTLPPCRVLDTRNQAGPLGAPSLQPGATRTFDMATSTCGIPADAIAISANLTATNLGAQGELVVFPSDISKPNTYAICFRAGRTRANNAIVKFSSSGTTFSVFNSSPSTVDFILDVNGYFR